MQLKTGIIFFYLLLRAIQVLTEYSRLEIFVEPLSQMLDMAYQLIWILKSCKDDNISDNYGFWSMMRLASSVDYQFWKLLLGNWTLLYWWASRISGLCTFVGPINKRVIITIVHLRNADQKAIMRRISHHDCWVFYLLLWPAIGPRCC